MLHLSGPANAQFLRLAGMPCGHVAVAARRDAGIVDVRSVTFGQENDTTGKR